MSAPQKKLHDIPVDFVDFEGKGREPASTYMNALIALKLLGAPCSYDQFRDKRYVAGHEMLTDASGQLTDEVCLALRHHCRMSFNFDPGKNATWDAVQYFCRLNSFHPVLDYLEPLKWDETPRVDTWMQDYLGSPDTPFIRAVGRIVLTGSVRRIKQPGCKFDYITVLESPEGFNKSTALATLYGAEFFSDQSILGLSDKDLQETVRGRWCLEAADLSGMVRSEVERVKAQLSRVVDRARAAYARSVIDAPRSCVAWGTTNDTEYLRSQHGNRRFLPVPVGRIDLEALARDRDQLWAEAVAIEATGESIMLASEYWAEATREQAARTSWDPWIELVRNAPARAVRYMADHGAAGELVGDDLGPVYEGERGYRERIASAFVARIVLGIPEERQHAEAFKRIGLAMRKHGWEGPKPVRIDGRVMKGFERELDPLA